MEVPQAHIGEIPWKIQVKSFDGKQLMTSERNNYVSINYAP